VVVVKEVDASTPKLAEAIADGKSFPVVKIDLCTSSEGGKRVPYLQWELKNVRVTDYNVSATGDEGAVPTEQLAFNFEEIKQVYDKLDKQNKSQGKVEYTWKIEEGTE
jgi:type VI secretion system Hcp family effector